MDHRINTGAGMEWIDEGTGPVILPLHGLFGDIHDWADFVEDFKRVGRILVPRLPVYTLPPQDANVTALVGWVHRFIEHHRLTAINLVGNSLGGLLALMYVRAYPERINTLTLTGSSGLRENAMAGNALRGRSSYRRDDYDLVRSIAEMTVYDPGKAPAQRVKDVFEVINDDAKVANIIGVVKSGMRMKMAQALPQIAHATCLIWGRDDTITPPDVAEEFHTLIPDSDLFWIDRCRHAPMAEHPREFNELLFAWYEKRRVIRGLSRSAG